MKIALLRHKQQNFGGNHLKTNIRRVYLFILSMAASDARVSVRDCAIVVYLYIYIYI